MLDGAAHACELPDEGPPKEGQVRTLGDVLAKIEEVTIGEDGKPPLIATREHETPQTTP
jgi:hypothetical protein